MPFYEFECFDCRYTDSVELKINDRNKKQPCRKCGVNMERVISTVNVINANTGGRNT